MPNDTFNIKPNGKNLIVELLMANQNETLTVKDAIAVGALFGLSSNNIRVALARLNAEGLTKTTRRGCYNLGPNAITLANDLSQWRKIESRLRCWQGDYIAVYSAGLGRTDRTALRRRERALSILGFAALDKGLHIRPNNIEQSVERVRERLISLGLEPESHVFVASYFDAVDEAKIYQLWSHATLDQQYQKRAAQLDAWLATADTLDPETAAREAFLHGRIAIKHLVFDPLLPDQMIDAQARQHFFNSVRRFDVIGREIWRKLKLSFSIERLDSDS
jgi:phenylacetic acid degradation operon negative regulatory protein